MKEAKLIALATIETSLQGCPTFPRQLGLASLQVLVNEPWGRARVTEPWHEGQIPPVLC